MPTPPQTTHALSDLSPDRSQRKDLLLEVFGEHLFWMRNERLSTLRELLNSPDARQRIGTINGKPFEAMAARGPEACVAALDVARAAIDLYIQDVLTLLTDIGGDMRLGPEHSVRYRLISEVRQTETGALIADETINREGPQWLPGYFGKWLNRYKNWGLAATPDDNSEVR